MNKEDHIYSIKNKICTIKDKVSLKNIVLIELL